MSGTAYFSPPICAVGTRSLPTGGSSSIFEEGEATDPTLNTSAVYAAGARRNHRQYRWFRAGSAETGAFSGPGDKAPALLFGLPALAMTISSPAAARFTSLESFVFATADVDSVGHCRTSVTPFLHFAYLIAALVVGFDLRLLHGAAGMLGQRPLNGPGGRFSAKARAASWKSSVR